MHIIYIFAYVYAAYIRRKPSSNLDVIGPNKRLFSHYYNENFERQ